jgi:hypothetical protein
LEVRRISFATGCGDGSADCAAAHTGTARLMSQAARIASSPASIDIGLGKSMTDV